MFSTDRSLSPAFVLMAMLVVGYAPSTRSAAASLPALGVECNHCHVPGQWDADEKATKEIAREMSAMVTMIDGEVLKKVPNLRSTNPSVNCTTCHRGQTRPALELPAAAATRASAKD